MFLEQLYSAFTGDHQKRALDFDEFVDGLSIFMKGNTQEKLSCKSIYTVLNIYGDYSVFQVV